MKFRLFSRKTLPLFILLLVDVLLAALLVALMRHVQDLMDSDVKINLTEIVTQNKDLIAGRLLMSIKDLEFESDRMAAEMKTVGMVSGDEIRRYIDETSRKRNSDSLFVAGSSGILRWENGREVDISGRSYFRLALSGEANISDKLVSRLSGEEGFVVAVPLRYRGEIVGSVQRAYSYEEMYAMSSPSLFSSQGFMYIINSEGYVILHTRHPDCTQISDNYFRDLFANGNKTGSEQIMADVKNGRDGFMETMVGEQKLFSAYTPLDKIHNWFLVTTVPMKTVSPNGSSVISFFYVILLLFGLIFTSGIIYFLRYKNRQHDNLERIAFIDPITGGHTYSKLILEATKMMRSAPLLDFYVMKLDVDNFKYINKFYGFEFGDRVLAEISVAISRQLRPGEILARIAGDNFVVLLLDADQKRVSLMLSSIVVDDIGLYFSAGIYAVTDVDESINLMVEKAGTAAQAIKGSLTRNVNYYTDEFDRIAIHNEQIKRAVRQGLANSEFIPFFQPKVDIDTRVLVGCEALARWLTFDGKMVSPVEFIPLCEQSGLVVEIDLMIYEKVLRFLKDRLDEGMSCVPVSVNFSRLHLLNDGFTDKIIDKLNEYQVPARLIEIELTESAIFDNISLIYSFVEKMRAHGFMIAMDDFGSGYSSLNMLKDIPIDILKIDRGFIAESRENSRREVIFTAIAALAKQLNMRVVVEGVEFEANVDLMRKCGCTVAQGFYFARPMPANDFAAIMARGIC